MKPITQKYHGAMSRSSHNLINQTGVVQKQGNYACFIGRLQSNLNSARESEHPAAAEGTKTFKTVRHFLSYRITFFFAPTYVFRSNMQKKVT